MKGKGGEGKVLIGQNGEGGFVIVRGKGKQSATLSTDAYGGERRSL